MPTKSMTSREYFNKLSVLHGALIIAQLIFAGLASYLVVNGDFGQDNDLIGVLQIAVPVFAVASYTGSIFMSKMLLKGIIQKPILSEKLNAYKGALIIRWALLEAPAMFSLVAFLLTGNFQFIGYPVLFIALFIMNRPTPSMAALDLELNATDKNRIENPNNTITEVGLPE